MHEIFALAFKDLRLLLRDKAGFFFTFFFPLIFAIFFGSMFSGGGEDSRALSIFVVDEDGTEQSRQFIQKLQKSDELEIEVTDRQHAAEQVRRGKRVAYVVLEKGFGAASERVFWGNPPKVELGVDPARRAEAGLLKGVLTKYAAERLQDVFRDSTTMRKQVKKALNAARTADAMPKQRRNSLIRFLKELDQFVIDVPQDSGNEARGFEPLVVEEAKVVREWQGPRNAFSISFPQGIIWGVIGCAAAFGISFVTERTKGTLVRLRTAPINRLQILAGKALACFATTVAITVVLFLIAKVVFDVRPDSLWLLALAIFAVSICFVGIMMLLSVLGKTEQAASGIGWAILLVMAMLGGGMIPLFIMPSWMKSVSHVSPVKWSILAMEGAVWRNFTLSEMLVPCGILVAVGIVFFVVGVRAFHWTEMN
ncbi:ABC transporter permease [candidate division KSB1 bacterium]|nr:ABC transporter permease [candidate division KSB1 bacterium]